MVQNKNHSQLRRNKKYSKLKEYIKDNKIQKEKYREDFANKHFQGYLAEDFKNFDDMSIELTMEWLK